MSKLFKRSDMESDDYDAKILFKDVTDKGVPATRILVDFGDDPKKLLTRSVIMACCIRRLHEEGGMQPLSRLICPELFEPEDTEGDAPSPRLVTG